jgi:hypothetical protein
MLSSCVTFSTEASADGVQTPLVQVIFDVAPDEITTAASADGTAVNESTKTASAV